MQNMKNLIDNVTFFWLFLQFQIKFGPNFAPKTPPILVLFTNFHLHMFEKSINSNKLCCYTPVLKKMVKT